jgi:hypothetical protein
MRTCAFFRMIYLAKTEHLVGGLFWRQNFSPFTRPRRITCLFLCACGSFAANVYLLGEHGVPQTARIISGLLSSVLLVPAIAVFCLIFRRIHTSQTWRMHARRHARRVAQSVVLKIAARSATRKDSKPAEERAPRPPDSTKPVYVRRAHAQVSFHACSSLAFSCCLLRVAYGSIPAIHTQTHMYHKSQGARQDFVIMMFFFVFPSVFVCSCLVRLRQYRHFNQ